MKENYKTLMKIIKELRKWRDIPCSWRGTLNVVKKSFLPRLFCTFTTIPMKIPASCFVDIDQLILKFLWRSKRPGIDYTILKKKDKVGRLTLHNFKIYYKTTAIKTVCYCKE